MKFKSGGELGRAEAIRSEVDLIAIAYPNTVTNSVKMMKVATFQG